MTPRVEIGVARLGPITVRFFRNGDPAMCQHFDGNCMWRRGVMHIDLNERLFDPKRRGRLKAVVLHEVTHAIEYLNSHEFLSAATNEDNCSELAQAMEWGLTSVSKSLTGPLKRLAKL